MKTKLKEGANLIEAPPLALFIRGRTSAAPTFSPARAELHFRYERPISGLLHTLAGAIVANFSCFQGLL
jgi:hypothetical protein